MARPQSKAELLTAATSQYEKMQQLIDTIPSDQQMTPFIFDISKETGAHWQRDKNLRDVLIHLHEWHQLLLNWVKNNQDGNTQQFLRSGYNWKTYGAMNEEIWQEHQGTSFSEAQKMLAESHQKVLALAETFNTEELFTKKVFPWVGGSTLGSYFVSATSSHYDWAMKKIRKFKKSLA